LISQVIAHYLTMMVNEPSAPLLWKAGRITGWMEALMENAPQAFSSVLGEEQITALHKV
jgi:hypothetical protein